MKIAIEGMDGSGKTTIAKMLSEKLKYNYVDKPFTFIFDSLNLTSSQIKKLEWKLYETEDEALLTLFYGLGILYGTRCNHEENVIYDRHFVSNYYWHGNEETNVLHNELLKLCGYPDLTVLLKASVSTRMKRIFQRDNNDPDLSNRAMHDDGYDKMETYLKTHNFNYIVVDSEIFTPEEIVNIIIDSINNISLAKLSIEGKRKL